MGDPVADLNPVVALTEQKVKDDVALAQREAAGNPLLTNILKRIGGLAIKAATGGLLVLALMLCSGCQKTDAGKQLTLNIERSVEALNEGHLAFEEGFIQDFRTRETERIDALYADSVKSQTKKIRLPVTELILVRTVAADGKVTEKDEPVVKEITQDFISPAISEALMRQKQRLYAQLELNTIEWRKKQLAIARNAANARACTEGMRAYFDQKAQTFEAMNQVSNGFLDFMDKFLGKEKVPKQN